MIKIIKDIKSKLTSFGLEENQIFEIVEELYNENNKIIKMFPKMKLGDLAVLQFDYLLKEFAYLPYEFSLKDIILNDEFSLKDFIYNYMIFRLKYDIKVKGTTYETHLSDFISKIIRYLNLNLDYEEDYKIFSFDKKMSFEYLQELISEHFDIEINLNFSEEFKEDNLINK